MPIFDSEENRTFSEALSAPLEHLIVSVAESVAEAQKALDQSTLDALIDITQGTSLQNLRALGYQPTWYTIPEAEAEIQISISVHEANNKESNRNRSQQQSSQFGDGEKRPNKVRLYANTLDASFTNRYSYDLRGSSKLKFKIMPVPAPARAEQIQVIPDLSERTLAEARDILDSMDIPFILESENMQDTDQILKTTPEAGAVLPIGGEVTLFKLILPEQDITPTSR